MKPMRLFILACLFCVPFLLSAAPIETYTFDSPEKEKAFHRLSDELRCLVCQNQNIAESNADLAKDLRQEIYTMLQNGQSEDEIVDFMVQRYGDYVLYRPPVKPLTWLLWFGPTVIFIIAVFYVARLVRAQARAQRPAELNEHDRDRISQLLSERDNQS
jgi:cytochrome c-type biogenesis protein CcmH